MKKLLYSISVCLLAITAQAQSAKVTWACKVLQSNDTSAAQMYGPVNCLGEPNNILNPFYNHNDSWIPGARKNALKSFVESETPVFAEFEFCEALVPAQLFIFETFSPGAIYKVDLIDINGARYTVVNTNVQLGLGTRGRFSPIPVANIKTAVKKVAIYLDPIKVENYNAIKAIGISDSKEAFKPSNSLPPSELFSSVRESMPITVDNVVSISSAEITSDNKHIFLTCYSSSDNTDLYEADGNGFTWGKFKPMGKPINNEKWNHPAAIMPCNNTLYMVNRYNPDGTYLDGAVSVSYKTANGWSHPENLVIEDWSNNHIYESYTVSYDHKFIVGQFGYKPCYGRGDLYAMIRKDDGTYGKPINLGPVVNTLGDEANPYLASDGKTLFFASDGHYGYGNLDIYVTKRLDDTWTNWSTPMNLGPKINTQGNELSFKMNAEGTFGYGYYGNPITNRTEIYRINIADKSIIKPKPVHFFCGTVHEGKTGKEMVARVRIQNLDNGKTEADFTTNKYNGAFQLMMEDRPGNYAIFAESPGYISVRKEYKIEPNNRYTEHPIDILLYPLELNTKVTLNTVYFKQSSAELLPQSSNELNSIVEIMNKNPKMKIEIRGHTDNVGNPKDLYKLSLDRATAVKTFLTQQGIETSRISTKGFGGTVPVNSNSTEEERLQNRRVEFLITQF